MPSQGHADGEGRTTRRGFLKSSTTGATAAAGALAIGQGAHAAGDDAIRIGLIGCGGRGTGAAGESLQAGPYVKLVALGDVFDDKVQSTRQRLLQRFPDQVKVDDDHCFVGFDGYREVIDAADVVLIACASKFHPMYAEAAIRADKHVFVEKPHGIDPEGVHRMRRVCELARQKKRSIVSGLQSRFHAGWRETVQRIHDGAIGDIVAIQAMFLRAPYQLVKRDPKLTEVQYQLRNWYHFCWLSGDDVTQSLVHNVDRASWIMQEETPTWAFGLAGRSASFAEACGDMFDHHSVVYEYASGTRLYALCRTQSGCYQNAGDIVMGTKGTCDLARCRIRGEKEWRFKGPHNNPYLAEQKALIDAVRNGEPVNSGYHMADSTMITVLGQMACYTGKPLTWKWVQDSNFRFGPPPESASFDIKPPARPDKTGHYPLPKPGVTKLVG